MTNKKVKSFWASRDLESNTNIGINDGLKDHIKLWDSRPTFIEPNNVFVGKVYMGMFDVGDFDIDLEPGDLAEVTVTITKA